jgi:hypothetical protein
MAKEIAAIETGGGLKVPRICTFRAVALAIRLN